MPTGFARPFAALSLAIATALAPTAAGAADYLIGDRPDVSTPDGECAQEKILGKIVKRFRHQVTHVPHLPDVEITAFENPHEHRFVPETEERLIARRYCMATAILDSGEKRSVWYVIEGGMGFATAWGDGVQFCVSGFDRWNVYDAWCRVLR